VNLAREAYRLGKPMGAICIAPAMMARIFGEAIPLELTIGTDKETANAINTMGSRHINCAAANIVVDSKHKVISTPAYMLAGSIKEAAEGIEKLVKAILDMVELRNDILSEITRLYFERRKLQIEVLTLKDLSEKGSLEKKMRILELTAMIDRLTGGAFSKDLKSSV